jgi:hypothetical protein
MARVAHVVEPTVEPVRGIGGGPTPVAGSADGEVVDEEQPASTPAARATTPRGANSLLGRED